MIKKIIALILLIASWQNVLAMENIIETMPENPIQGEPLIIKIENVTLNDIARVEFNGKSLWFFNHKNTVTSFYGIDLNMKPNDYEIKIKMEDGTIFKKNITIKAREKIEAPLGIPEKLGGNTPTAATSLVTNLSKENALINNVFSASKKYWLNDFRYPLEKNEITDNYGYSRQTVQYSIAHKGVDFRAKEGTSLYSINRGVVRLARNSTVYGKTIAIDHGLGVISYYMHLSKIYVSEGQLVKVGENIGLSGSTGYAESPHLHLSIKIGGISIDPIIFLDLLK